MFLYNSGNNNGFFPLTHGLSGNVYTECNKSTHSLITKVPSN